ncbi:MAG: transposase [Candidatus Sedimenticola sp. PURPLELP]
MSYNALRKGRFSENDREYFITTVTHNRKPLFRSLECAQICIKTFRDVAVENKSQWLAWVLMPDHFHGLLLLGESQDISKVVGYAKGRSSKLINGVINHSTRVWQPGFYDHALRREEDRLVLARYIIANPLRKGLVERLCDYPYWDSVWL